MLIVCPTPIGNLEDITLRVLRVLKEADLILAEDTRHTGRLLQHFGIKNRLASFHEHNEKEKSDEIIAALQQGRQIALVSDAGMPGISDPGAFLIKRVIEKNLPLQVLPGPNAAVTAYLQSGLIEDHFIFYGFLPRRTKKRRQKLKELKDLSFPLIFYEAPHRLKDTLRDLLEIFGPRRAALSRELTKLHEETVRGTLADIDAFLQAGPPRGEFVLTVAGAVAEKDEKTEGDIRRALAELLAKGMTRRSAITKVSEKYRLPKNRVYEIALTLKTED
ncbi:MAG TPA: 16S rRNA (cytidine(1402)-2'-O)-methyltransferase [Firmicutes bacterium]|nr:16S rRNA (cytidine(1402)-2'-O)-methyltransferase [Bacillota bacterium]